MCDIFKESGIKRTGQREAVLEVISTSNLPMTAEDIFKKTSGISLATVYRALEVFCRGGVVSKISVGDDERRYYEMASEKHRHYAVCLECHRMEYIDFCPVKDIRLGDFHVTGHRLELYGYCKECSQKKGQ